MSYRTADTCYRLAGAGCSDAAIAALQAEDISLDARIDVLEAGSGSGQDPLVYGVGTQVVTRDGSNNAQDTINPNHTLLELGTNGEALSLVYSTAGVTPFISDGATDGQLLVLQNKRSGTIQFNAGVTGSNVRLEGNTNKSVLGEDYIQFRWSALNSTWDQVVSIVAIA